MQVNNFTSRPTFPSLEMEGAVLSSEVVTYLNSLFREGMQELTQVLIDQILVNKLIQTSFKLICIVYIIYACVSFIILVTFIRKFFEHEFSMVKRFIILLPQSTLFLENHFERALRLMIVKENLI